MPDAGAADRVAAAAGVGFQVALGSLLGHATLAGLRPEDAAATLRRLADQLDGATEEADAAWADADCADADGAAPARWRALTETRAMIDVGVIEAGLAGDALRAGTPLVASDRARIAQAIAAAVPALDVEPSPGGRSRIARTALDAAPELLRDIARRRLRAECAMAGVAP